MLMTTGQHQDTKTDWHWVHWQKTGCGNRNFTIKHLVLLQQLLLELRTMHYLCANGHSPGEPARSSFFHSHLSIHKTATQLNYITKQCLSNEPFLMTECSTIQCHLPTDPRHCSSTTINTRHALQSHWVTIFPLKLKF